MSEQDKQDDQITSESPDSQSDDVSTTNETDISSELDGEENKQLDLDDSPEESAEQKEQEANKAKQQRDKQIESWSERYYSGDVELTAVPKWIRKEINEANTPDKEADFDRKFEARMAKAKDAEKYTMQKEALNDASMTDDQRKTLVKEFKQLKRDGVPQGRALDLAVRVASVKLAKADGTVKNPVTSGKENVSDKGKSYTDITKNMTDSEKADYLEKNVGW